VTAKVAEFLVRTEPPDHGTAPVEVVALTQQEAANE
jgi:hypothetical protein